MICRFNAKCSDENKTMQHRALNQRFVVSGILLNRFSIESPHKPLPPARPRWRQVSYMITRSIPSFITRPARPIASKASIPKRRRQTNNLFHPNVPLQTREHALAGISGMLRSLAGAQGAFTSRGAKPKGLNLMLMGLTKSQQQQQQTIDDKTITVKHRRTSTCVFSV
jgi:hypothetical protein